MDNQNTQPRLPPNRLSPSVRHCFATGCRPAVSLRNALIILASLLAFSWQASAAELFPTYPDISTNVQFWEDIYSRYTTRQGVLHDQDNLTMVYDVVELVDWNTPGSAHINKKLIKLARQHYKSILTDLAAGKKPPHR